MGSKLVLEANGYLGTTTVYQSEACAIDVSDFKTIVLIIRVTSVSSVTGSPDIYIETCNDLGSQDGEWATSSALQVTLGTTVANYYLDVTGLVGRYIKYKTGPTSSGSLYFTIEGWARKA